MSGKWISVKDELPKDCPLLLVYDLQEGVTAACCSWGRTSKEEPVLYWYTVTQGDYNEGLYQVTHWMPLPDPPSDNQLLYDDGKPRKEQP